MHGSSGRLRGPCLRETVVRCDLGRAMRSPLPVGGRPLCRRLRGPRSRAVLARWGSVGLPAACTDATPRVRSVLAECVSRVRLPFALPHPATLPPRLRPFRNLIAFHHHRSKHRTSPRPPQQSTAIPHPHSCSTSHLFTPRTPLGCSANADAASH